MLDMWPSLSDFYQCVELLSTLRSIYNMEYAVFLLTKTNHFIEHFAK